MRDRRHSILKAIFILYIIGLCFCCFWNFRGSIDLGTEWWGIPKDKIVHFFLFFPFPIVFYLAFPKLRNSPRRYLKFSILALAAGLLLGTATEVIQGWSGYRSCDPADLLADFCGMVTAILLLQTYEAFIRKKRRGKE